MRTDQHNYLIHHGIKGQKWGVRRFQNADGTRTVAGKRRYRSGELTLEENELGKISKLIGKLSPRAAENQAKSLSFSVKDKTGRKVGNLFLDRKSSDELNINWIDIKKTYRGRGYAQSVLSTDKREAQNAGYKKLSLEVPDEDPAALHIYKKMGFVVTGRSEDDGVLTNMELSLQHSELGYRVRRSTLQY